MVRNEKRFHRQAAEEIRILEHLRKQDKDNTMNVIHMLENFTFRNHICMTFELLSMNLYELIKKNKFQGFSLPLVRKFAHSILQCLDALHKNRIIHCDLKPSPIALPPLRASNATTTAHTIGGSKHTMNDHLHLNSHGQIQVQQLFEDNSNKRTVLTTQPNGLTTVGKTGLPGVPERQLESIHRRQGSSTSLKSMEGMGKVKASPMTPEQAMKQYMQKLTAFEHHEIFSYPEIYFLGPNAKKRQGMTGGPNNGGYDDDQGSYVQVPHDHVAYRYEVLKVIGKGSFGQVVKAYDHKVHQHVALKMVRNEKRFHRQAAEKSPRKNTIPLLS